MMIATHDMANDIANDWAGDAISEQLVQDREVVTAARLEGLLMAACAAPRSYMGEDCAAAATAAGC